MSGARPRVSWAGCWSRRMPAAGIGDALNAVRLLLWLRAGGVGWTLEDVRALSWTEFRQWLAYMAVERR